MAEGDVSTLYDPIMDALLAVLREECGTTFKTYSRRFRMWEDLAQVIDNGIAVQQPALYLYDGPGLGGGKTSYVQKGSGTPAIRTMFRTIVIYNRIPGSGTPNYRDDTTPGASMFYPLIESVEAALEKQTFGSSQSRGVKLLTDKMTGYCWIEGDSVIVPGEIDPNGQGMATLPVKILIP